MSKKNKNFLELTPEKSEKTQWELKDDKVVQLTVYRNSIFDKIAQKFFNRPASSTIDLDKIGSLVWLNIDGYKNIYDISKILEKELGDEAKPLNERLITYIKILKNNNFIKI